MKFLKLTFVLVLFVFFSSLTTSAQKKTTEVYHVPISGYYLDCADDLLSGELVLTIKDWSNKHQEKWKGELTGSTGTYTVSQVGNSHWKDWTENGPWNWTETFTLSFEKDGMEIGVLHGTYHMTRNANGVWTVDLEHVVNKCY